MTNGFEENEISKKSFGGTEQVKRMIASKMPEDIMDNFQVICSRVREIQEDKIRVYWLHDLPEDPETNHLREENSRNRFHKFVFCGNWQYNRYMDMLGVPKNDKCVVLDTPIEPFDNVEKSKDEIRLMYTSTPQRGLEILIPVFEELSKRYDNLYLDVFSSFEIYGWNEANKPYEHLFEVCKNHPKIVYHGFKPNEEVRKAYEKAHIFAYPSIWPECNSRALIEAMSAGLLCVHPNYAGLSDTSGNLTVMYQYEENKLDHANKFLQVLDHSIKIVNEKSDSLENYLRFVKAYADNRYNVSKISNQWIDVLQQLIQKYPDSESRKIPPEKFVYRT